MHYAPPFTFLSLRYLFGVACLISWLLLTALFASRLLGERLGLRSWLGVGLGLFGVALVVWHKINFQAASGASLIAVGISLAAITSASVALVSGRRQPSGAAAAERARGREPVPGRGGD